MSDASAARDVVIDTNVVVVANARVSTTSAGCVQACVELLERTIARGRVLLDTTGAVLTEYQTYCEYRGAPGVGDVFFRWLHDNEFNEEACKRVLLHPDDSRGYAEFPEGPGLAGFDDADRKFVALSASQQPVAPIIVATDRGWRRFEVALNEASIVMQFLCPHDLPPNAETS